MRENKLEKLKERGENIFSILNDIFRFGAFLDGDDQEILKRNIHAYSKRDKAENSKNIILMCFCKSLNRVTPKNKKYEIEKIKKIFSNIEFLYNLNVFQHYEKLKFLLGVPLLYNYISKITNFSDKWRDVLFPFDLELDYIPLKINGSFESFYRNNKKIFDKKFMNIDLQTIRNWKGERNTISAESIYKAIKNIEVLSQDEEEFFQILYLKRIILKIYTDLEEKNKKELKEIVRTIFKIIFIFSSSDEETDEEKKKKLLNLITKEANMKNKEKSIFLKNFEKMEILDKNIKNSKIDFEKIWIKTINSTKFNNKNIYIFNDEYNKLKKDYRLDKHKELLKELENKVQLIDYYEYNYYIYFLVDSYNLLNTEKEKYKNQKLRDSKRFLEKLEKYYNGKLNGKIIEEYKKNFKGENRSIVGIFNTILQISPNIYLILEILLKRIFSRGKLLNKFQKYIEKNFNLTLISEGGEKYVNKNDTRSSCKNTISNG